MAHDFPENDAGRADVAFPVTFKSAAQQLAMHQASDPSGAQLIGSQRVPVEENPLRVPVVESDSFLVARGLKAVMEVIERQHFRHPLDRVAGADLQP